MKRIHLLLVILGTFILVSCEHKPLYYGFGASDIDVYFLWDKAQNAQPESMSVYFFPTQKGQEVIRYDISGCEHGTIRVPFGEYEVCCVNSDTENIRYKNTDSYRLFEFLTPQTKLLSSFGSLGLSSIKENEIPRATETENERVAMIPDKIWTDGPQYINYTFTEERYEIVFHPEPRVCDYYVEVRNVDNLEYLAGVSASISTLTGNIFLCDLDQENEAVTIPFQMTPYKAEKKLKGQLQTFGEFSGKDTRNQLIIYTVLSDGQKYYYTFDITDQIVEAPNPFEVHILIDELPIPEPIEGGGFQPTIDDWETCEEEIQM